MRRAFRLSGYSRAQITRLVSRWDGGKRLVKNYRASGVALDHPLACGRAGSADHSLHEPG